MDNTKKFNHSEDIIEMKKYCFESGSDVFHSLMSSRVVGIVSDTGTDTSTLHTYSKQMILYPMFLVMEKTSYDSEPSSFGQRFGVLFQSDNGLWYTRRVTSTELLSVYSIEIDKDAVFPTKLDSVLDDIVPHSIPWNFRNSMMRDNTYITNLLEPLSNSDTQQCDTSQCYFTSTTPELLDWTNTYNDDIDTIFITSKLLDSQQVTWNDKELSKINSVYHVPLKDNIIQIVN